MDDPSNQVESRVPSRRRHVMFAGLAVLLGIIGAGVIGEVALRLGGYSRSYLNPLGSFHEGHPLVGYRGKPNFVGRYRTAEFDAVIAQDANGFRQQEHQTPRAQSRHAVLVFGDSFTWGWGVGQGLGCTDQMSLRMPGYSVMNFGLNGSGTVQQYALFEVYGTPALQPGDTVVLMFFGNDFNDNTGGLLHAEVQDGTVRQVGPTKQLGSRSLPKDASYVINLIVYTADRLTAALKNKQAANWTSTWIALGDRSPEIAVAKHYLAAFQHACAERQARFVAAYIPGQAELGEASPLTEQRVQIEQAYRGAFFDGAASLGIQTIDLLPHFLAAQQTAGGRFTFAHDEHWNARGHALAAQVLSQFILDADAPPH
jgi:lysophospholipase L1-like esterase